MSDPASTVGHPPGGMPASVYEQAAQLAETINDQVPEFSIEDPSLLAILAAALGAGGGGGGGGGAAPQDPAVTAAEGFYLQLWGVKPPTNYIEGFFRQGHDLFDFMREQLARPGAAKQQFFRDQYAQYAALLAQTMGKR